ncbi:MAG TPA: aspartyl/asparaginyl beta-hydroxylase domain-containing protein [Candidatus Paceibacterota bacterium]|nr:aspartyl/asparaginyl beta-hydroxylase domain-containing protein [Candidatus Paceibacterota bacterium]
MLPPKHLLLDSHIDVSPFSDEIRHIYDVADSTRAAQVKYHEHTVSAALFNLDLAKDQSREAYQHSQITVETPYTKEFPHIVSWVQGYAKAKHSVVSRAQMVVLKPKMPVHKHIDVGLYYALRARYHLVLSSEGSTMHAGNEQKVFHTGDVFVFPNTVMHWAYNEGDTDRIHLIFDLLPKSTLALCVRFIYWLVVLHPQQKRQKGVELINFSKAWKYFKDAVSFANGTR